MYRIMTTHIVDVEVDSQHFDNLVRITRKPARVLNDSVHFDLRHHPEIKDTVAWFAKQLENEVPGVELESVFLNADIINVFRI